MHQALGAQVRDTILKRPDSLTIPIPPGADSLLRDSLAKRGVRAEKPDTIKAPFAHAEHPAPFGIAQRFRWTRDSIFATGAITLADLLERVPGVTTYHAGWISSPATAAYLGDFRQVRVFIDGFEMPVLDPRGGNILDLTQVNIWGAEEIDLEQSPEEIRVYIRTWRVQQTTAETRTDVNTGDQQTNLYRGYYGRRYGDGAGLQFGAQQYGTTPPSAFGTSSDQTALLGRAGWANRWLSVDAFATHNSRHRGDIFSPPSAFAILDTIPSLESTRLDGYIRVAHGDPDTSRVWGQAMVVGSKYHYTGIRSFTGVPITPHDSLLVTAPLDTNVYRSQYLATVGGGFGPLRLSLTGRVFGGGEHSLFTPSARASFSTRPLIISARVEGKSIDSLSRADVTAQLTPLPFVSFLGAVGRSTTHDEIRPTSFVLSSPPPGIDSTFSTRYARGEAGLRLFNLWFVGGVLWRDSTRLFAPIIYDTLFQRRPVNSATAYTAAIRGKIWGPFGADLQAVRWNDDDSLRLYRPRYQTRSELYVKTNLLNRFPTGDFGLLFSVVHEYRSGVFFPINGAPDTLSSIGYRTISTLLEIRILSATLTWQFRNLLGQRYFQVPTFIMPRQTNFYGVRWYFFN